MVCTMSHPSRGSQCLVRGLDGRTRCVQFPHDVVTGLELKTQVQHLEGIPLGMQRLVCGAREVHDELTLVADNEHQLPTCHVLLRLRAGKGGFGSLLRGAAKNKTATDNIDSCRDLSGRRLRHVNAEKKLNEWQEESQQREMEDIAKKFIKQQEKAQRGEELNREIAEAVAHESEKATKIVASAVQNGLVEAQKLAEQRLKRQEAERSAQAGPSKRQCLWGLPEADDSDEDDSDDEEEAADKASLPSSSGKESPSSTDTSNTPAPTTPPAEEVVVEVPTVPEPVNVNLQTANSAKDLEMMGMDLLKEKLTKYGLKCGGSLKERAERLFILKTTPLEAVDKKHFAKK